MTDSTIQHAVIGAIAEKWQQLGGEGGFGVPLDVELPTFDGVGRAQEFQGGGTISWHPATGAFAVWGAIKERWVELGREQYGYPITDESGCPDGRGRYNHFRAVQLEGSPEGSIYWTPQTGAQPVYGGIRQRWADLGWERSALGYPTGAEADIPEGGRAQTFEHRNMYWWGDTGAIDVGDVVVRYRGMCCFGEDDTTGSDEPYVIVGVATPTGQPPTFMREYDDVDAGGSFPEATDLYRGLPHGLTLAVTIMENDEGNPEDFRDQVQKVVAGAMASAGLATAAIPVVGPFIAPIVTPALTALAVPVAKELTSWLADELIGTQSITLSQKQLCTLVDGPRLKERDVEHQIPTALLSNGDGSYKAYFDVVRA